MIPTPSWVQNAEFGSGLQNSFPLETRHTNTSVGESFPRAYFEHNSAEWALIREPQKRTYLLLFPHDYRENVPNPGNQRRYPVQERTNFGLTWQKRKTKLDSMCSAEMGGVRGALIREDSEVFLLVVPVRFSRVWQESRREFRKQHKNLSDEFDSPQFLAGQSDPLLPLIVGFIAVNRVVSSKLDFVCISPYWREPLGRSKGIGSLLVSLFELNNTVTEMHLEALNQAATVEFYLRRNWGLVELKHGIWIESLRDATGALQRDKRGEQFREQDGTAPLVIPMQKETQLIVALDEANETISRLEELLSKVSIEALSFNRRFKLLLNDDMDTQ